MSKEEEGNALEKISKICTKLRHVNNWATSPLSLLAKKVELQGLLMEFSKNPNKLRLKQMHQWLKPIQKGVKM